jgi:hypothetical protein
MSCLRHQQMMKILIFGIVEQELQPIVLFGTFLPTKRKTK